uniref:Mannosyltransferase n=1 Tax=Salix viminalis TaxID=40686 RepID=A0A6N2M2E2_SALVM
MRASPSKAPLVLRKWGLAIAALACAIRPTSAVTWVYIGLLELAVTRDRLKFLVLEGFGAWAFMFIGSFDGFTVMLFTFLPFSIAGSIKSKCWKLSGLIAWVLIVYSVQGHKEFRFVLPMLPIALMFSGYSLSVMEKADSDSRRKGSLDSHMKRPSKVGFAIFFLLATNIPMALYMSLVHQRN